MDRQNSALKRGWLRQAPWGASAFARFTPTRRERGQDYPGPALCLWTSC